MPTTDAGAPVVPVAHTGTEPVRYVHRSAAPGPVESILMVVLAAVLAGSLFAIPLLPALAPQWSGQAPQAVPLPTGSGEVHQPLPEPTVRREPPLTVLMAPAISGSCSTPVRPASKKKAQADADTYLACLKAVWQPRVEAAGMTWRDPKMVFDPAERRGPCGPTPDPYRFPAFYCPVNETIYLSSVALQASTLQRLLEVEILAHEYAHHIQHISGLLDLNLDTYGSGSGLRRIELQAHCLAFVVIGHVDGWEPTKADLAYFASSWADGADPQGHGSAKAQAYWGQLGLDSASPAACDTFNADETLVT